MPLRPPDPRTIGMNRQLVDLEDRVLNLQHQRGGTCNVEPGSMETVDMKLDTILRELAEIKAALTQLAKTQSPQPPTPQKSRKK
jgi:hypothetical protein